MSREQWKIYAQEKWQLGRQVDMDMGILESIKDLLDNLQYNEELQIRRKEEPRGTVLKVVG